MRHLLFLGFSLLIASFINSEKDENYSIYFDGKNVPHTEKLATINTSKYGSYGLVPRSENDLRDIAGDRLIMDETGIYLEKNKLLAISREEVRENSKYWVSDGYLHGVLKGDSVMVALEDDSYYFLIPKKTYLCEYDSAENMLFRGSSTDQFLVLSKETNRHYSALYLQFSGNQVALMELNFDQQEFDFRSVNHQKIADDNSPIYLLKPNADEWKKLMQYFRPYDTYEKSVQ